MNIDGNDIRMSSIDGVTEIEVKLGGVNEGTDKMARGSFDILVRGNRVKIYRSERCTSDKVAGQEACAHVRYELDGVRAKIIKAIFV